MRGTAGTGVSQKDQQIKRNSFTISKKEKKARALQEVAGPHLMR